MFYRLNVFISQINMLNPTSHCGGIWRWGLCVVIGSREQRPDE